MQNDNALVKGYIIEQEYLDTIAYTVPVVSEQ